MCNTGGKSVQDMSDKELSAAYDHVNRNPTNRNIGKKKDLEAEIERRKAEPVIQDIKDLKSRLGTLGYEEVLKESKALGERVKGAERATPAYTELGLQINKLTKERSAYQEAAKNRETLVSQAIKGVNEEQKRLARKKRGRQATIVGGTLVGS